MLQESQTSEAQILEEPRVIYSKVPNSKPVPISLTVHEKDAPTEKDSTQSYFSTYALPSPTTTCDLGSGLIGLIFFLFHGLVIRHLLHMHD